MFSLFSLLVAQEEEIMSVWAPNVKGQ